MMIDDTDKRFVEQTTARDVEFYNYCKENLHERLLKPKKVCRTSHPQTWYCF